MWTLLRVTMTRSYLIRRVTISAILWLLVIAVCGWVKWTLSILMCWLDLLMQCNWIVVLLPLFTQALISSDTLTASMHAPSNSMLHPASTRLSYQTCRPSSPISNSNESNRIKTRQSSFKRLSTPTSTPVFRPQLPTAQPLPHPQKWRCSLKTVTSWWGSWT